jgi:fluoroacetyl-CoA thioesterase
MAITDIQPGIKFQQNITVNESLIVPALSNVFSGFVDMPNVFATAFLVGFAEWTCIELLRPYLTGDERTVGTLVNMSHCAATPIGLQVTAEVELIEVAGRKLRFKILCRDDKEIISEGFHERFIINYHKFSERLEKKLS